MKKTQGRRKQSNTEAARPLFVEITSTRPITKTTCPTCGKIALRCCDGQQEYFRCTGHAPVQSDGTPYTPQKMIIYSTAYWNAEGLKTQAQIVEEKKCLTNL